MSDEDDVVRQKIPHNDPRLRSLQPRNPYDMMKDIVRGAGLIVEIRRFLRVPPVDLYVMTEHERNGCLTLRLDALRTWLTVNRPDLVDHLDAAVAETALERDERTVQLQPLWPWKNTKTTP